MRWKVAIVATVFALVACASGSSVQGIVIDVEGDLTRVEAFTLRANGGEIIRLVPAEDGDFAFPVTHLQEHRQSLIPVEVVIETRDGVDVAIAIADADGADHNFTD